MNHIYNQSFDFSITKQRLLLPVLLVLLSIFGGLCLPQSTYAHSYVQESFPAQNEVLDKAPDKITLLFNESIQPAYYQIVLNDSSGQKIDGVKAVIDSKNAALLEATIPVQLPDDIYNISWKAVSGDGHPVEGGIVFQVGDGAGKKMSDAPTTIPDSKSVNPLLIVMRWLQYTGQSLVLGLLALSLFLLPARLRTSEATTWMRQRRYALFLWIGMALTVVALLVQLPLRIAWNADIPVTQTTTELGNTFRETTFGQVWLIQMIAAVLIVILLILYAHSKLTISAKRTIGMMAIALMIAQLLAKSLDGHAYAEPYAGIAIAADFIHLVSALIWSGALVAIAVFVPRIVAPFTGEERKTVYWSIIRRFSWWAIVSVAALLVTGIYGSIIYLPNLMALFNTAYGLTLLAKMLLFLVMAAFGAMNYVKGRQQKEELGKDLMWEVLTGFVILMLAAALVHLSPQAAPISNGATPKQTVQTQEVNGYEITLEVPKAQMGSNTFIVSVKNKNEAKAVDVEQITLTMNHMDMAMAPTEILLTANDGKDGVYQKTGMVSMNGNWNVKVHILTKSLDTIDTEFTLRIG